MSIYGAAEAYALAFSYRDIPAEVDAVLQLTGRAAPGAVLELAAGPADHAIELVRRGWRATALDLSPAMVALAQRSATAASVPLTTVTADMREIELDDRFDLALLMIDSISVLLTEADLVTHLRALRPHLNPGAHYVIEASFPEEVDEPSRTETEWEMVDGDRRVAIRWGQPDDPYDPLTRISQVQVHLEYSVGPLVIDEVVPGRSWTEADVRAAVALAGGYTVRAVVGDFAALAMTDPEAWRMIFVLRAD